MSLLSQYTDEDSDEDEMEIPSDRTMAGSVPNGQVIVAFFFFQIFCCCLHCSMSRLVKVHSFLLLFYLLSDHRKYGRN